MENLMSIETRYLGPTNARGSRIKAIFPSLAIIVPYDHGATNAHNMAATELLERLINIGEVPEGTKLLGRIQTPRGYIYTLGEK